MLDANFELRHQDILVVDNITKRVTELLQTHPAVDKEAGRPGAYLKSYGSTSITVGINATIKVCVFSSFFCFFSGIFFVGEEGCWRDDVVDRETVFTIEGLGGFGRWSGGGNIIKERDKRRVGVLGNY